ncbi:hypothetical protein GW17_00059281, partial [Ensete ventricosum]
KFARRFAKGIRKLAGNVKEGRRKEDRRTYRKIARGCRSMREFAEGIGKLVKNTKGDHRKEDRRTYRKIIEGFQSIREPEYMGVNRPYHRIWVAANC